MKIFNDLRNFINDNTYKIIINDNYIDIINYSEIIDISFNLIKIKTNKMITINGKNLNIIKMQDNELTIKGIINNIQFDE